MGSSQNKHPSRIQVLRQRSSSLSFCEPNLWSKGSWGSLEETLARYSTQVPTSISNRSSIRFESKTQSSNTNIKLELLATDCYSFRHFGQLLPRQHPSSVLQLHRGESARFLPRMGLGIVITFPRSFYMATHRFEVKLLGFDTGFDSASDSTICMTWIGDRITPNCKVNYWKLFQKDLASLHSYFSSSITFLCIRYQYVGDVDVTGCRKFKYKYCIFDSSSIREKYRWEL